MPCARIGFRAPSALTLQSWLRDLLLGKLGLRVRIRRDRSIGGVPGVPLIADRCGNRVSLRARMAPGSEAFLQQFSTRCGGNPRGSGMANSFQLTKPTEGSP